MVFRNSPWASGELPYNTQLEVENVFHLNKFTTFIWTYLEAIIQMEKILIEVPSWFCVFFPETV